MIILYINKNFFENISSIGRIANILNKPPSSATMGERIVFNRIEHFFSNKDDIFIYFEPELNGFRPDFLLISPTYGILIIEVKDYEPRFLKTITLTGPWTKIKEDIDI